jgi:hypothetical protein
MSDKEPKTFAVRFELTSRGTAYVLAHSAEDAQNHLESLSAEDLLTLDLSYETQVEGADEEDGEDWDFDATEDESEEEDEEGEDAEDESDEED